MKEDYQSDKIKELIKGNIKMVWCNYVLYLVGSITTIVCIILCFVLFFTCKSKTSTGERIELENKTHEKPWSLGNWIAGVFVAGTGVALMYAPSDLVGYINEGLNPVESIIMVALLNGAPVWALYSIMGLWYMNHMDSKIGKLAAMLSTILGMSISLWTGMNTVAHFVGLDFPGFKFMLATITVLLAMMSARFGWLKHISWLAFVVFVFAFLVLLSTPIKSFDLKPVEGGITVNFFKKYFLGETAASWIFWFLSWTPTVSRWLAHISKGRTMKEYIAGTMILPTVLALIWMIVSWMYQDIIMNFNLVNNFAYCIPCLVFIASGILFMTGTLDSDCKVFTEDLEELTKGKLNARTTSPYYVMFVIFFFTLFISGIIQNPFAFNEYSSLIFMPLMVWSILESFKMIKKK